VPKLIFSLLLTSLCLTTGAFADQPSPYRLQLGNSEDYRLAGERPVKTPSRSTLSGMPFAAEIALAAHEASLDPALVHALIHVESAHRAGAISPKGALGLMQLMPETARRFGSENALDPKANLRAGTRYLRFLLDHFGNRKDLALAAYNAGEGAVQRHGGNIPPFPETLRYVPAVLGKFNEFRATASIVKY
jgi:soluble lytic murein transglycosylase-like protein